MVWAWERIIKDLRIAPESDDPEDVSITPFVIPKKKANQIEVSHIPVPARIVTTQPPVEGQIAPSQASDQDESQATVEEATVSNRTNSPSPSLNTQDMSGFSPGIGFCADPQAEVIRGYYTKPRPRDSDHPEIIPVLPVVPEIRKATAPTPAPSPVPEENLLDYEDEFASEGETVDESATRTDSETDEPEIVRDSTRDRAAYEAAFLEYWNDSDSFLDRVIRERGEKQ